MPSSVHELVREWETLRSQRANWDSYWQRIHDLVWPESGNFTTMQTPGERRNTQVYDSTNSRALDKFSAVLESLLTPRNQIFHFLRAADPELRNNREVAEYLEHVNNQLFRSRARPNTGFYDQMTECYKSLGAYGNACVYVGPNTDRQGVYYRCIHIGNVWIELDYRGYVDTIYYRWRMSAKAAMQRWGDMSTSHIREVFKRDPYEQMPFLNVVKPRMMLEPGRLGAESMPYESWEIDVDGQEFVRYRNPVTGEITDSQGNMTRPYVYSRFSTNPSEKHGRGPSMTVSNDNETLQRMERSSLLAGEQAVTPTMLTMDSDLLQDETTGVDLRPAAVNPGWLDPQGRPKVAPLINGYDHNVSEDLMNKKQDSILDAHFVTLFQILVQTPEMTATEALIRAQEKGQLIAPMVGRQQTELLGPMVQRELELHYELQLIDEPPALLQEYEIEYTSMAARIQREEEVQSIRATLADIAAASAVDPTAAEVVDITESLRFIANARGVPPHLVRDDDEFEEIIRMQAERARQIEDAQLEALQPNAPTLQ